MYHIIAKSSFPCVLIARFCFYIINNFKKQTYSSSVRKLLPVSYNPYYSPFSWFKARIVSPCFVSSRKQQSFSLLVHESMEAPIMYSSILFEQMKATLFSSTSLHFCWSITGSRWNELRILRINKVEFRSLVQISCYRIDELSGDYRIIYLIRVYYHGMWSMSGPRFDVCSALSA